MNAVRLTEKDSDLTEKRLRINIGGIKELLKMVK